MTSWTPSFLRQPLLRPSALVALGAAALLELASACNVVRIGERQLSRKLERRGLSSASVAIGEANVHYWEGGQRDSSERPVILLHGFGAAAKWQWHEQAGPLAEHRRVILPDLLWFGGSWSRRRDYSIDHQIEVVLGLLDHLGIAEADFVGISYGGIVAHELAAMHPGRVGKLVLLDSPGRVYTAGDQAALLERFAVDDIGEVLVPDTTEGVRTLLELGYHRPPRTPRWVESQVLEGMYTQFRAEKRLLLDDLLGELDGLEERPGAVRQPTLIIWGREDRVFPLEIGERLADDLNASTGGRARLRVIDGAAHAPNLEHGELVARWLVEFVLEPSAGLEPRGVFEPPTGIQDSATHRRFAAGRSLRSLGGPGMR